MSVSSSGFPSSLESDSRIPRNAGLFSGSPQLLQAVLVAAQIHKLPKSYQVGLLSHELFPLLSHQNGSPNNSNALSSTSWGGRTALCPAGGRHLLSTEHLGSGNNNLWERVCLYISTECRFSGLDLRQIRHVTFPNTPVFLPGES